MANSSITKAGLNEVFNLQVAQGQIYKHSAVHKFGFNSAVGTAGTDTIWIQDGAYTWPAAASVLKVSSSSADDDSTPSAGTGALTVTLEGLDANYAEITEDVILNGVTTVNTTLSYLRLHRMFVATAGTGLTNAGVIYAFTGAETSGVPDVATTIRSTIAASQGQTLQAFYTVPAGMTAYMTSVNAGSADGTNATTIELRARTEGGAFRTQEKFVVFKQTTTLDFPYPLKFEAKTDIELRGASAAATPAVNGSFDLLLVKDA